VLVPLCWAVANAIRRVMTFLIDRSCDDNLPAPQVMELQPAAPQLQLNIHTHEPGNRSSSTQQRCFVTCSVIYMVMQAGWPSNARIREEASCHDPEDGRSLKRESSISIWYGAL
jgi:hypothetical protein